MSKFVQEVWQAVLLFHCCIDWVSSHCMIVVSAFSTSRHCLTQKSNSIVHSSSPSVDHKSFTFVFDDSTACFWGLHKLVTERLGPIKDPNLKVMGFNLAYPLRRQKIKTSVAIAHRACWSVLWTITLHWKVDGWRKINLIRRGIDRWMRSFENRYKLFGFDQ